MTEAEALAFLAGAGRFGELGLSRTERLLAALGNPQEGMRFFHVAGTNGKGSVTADVDAMLRRLGRRTGRFVSPHLVRPHERVTVDGREIDGESLALAADEVRRAASGMEDPPTEFELWTAVALMHFCRQGALEVAWETGLGGRWDATNVVTPEVSVITSIGLDHQDRLGGTLREIAGEKAGILKPGRPAVIGALPGEAMDVVEAEAARQGASIWRLGREVRIGEIRVSPEGTAFAYEDPFGPIQAQVSLVGGHQASNAALALAALRRTLGADEARRGAAALGEVRWPGRFEVRAGSPTVVLDGAHNPEGAAALRRTWADAFPGARPVVLFGCLADRDPKVVTAPLSGLWRSLHAVAPPSPRALSAKEAAQALGGVAHGEILEGLRAALAEASRHRAPLLVFGSLYLIGAVEAMLADSAL